jgi:hypothetical protein
MCNNGDFAAAREVAGESYTMKQFFELQEQETISDEQVERILAPVLQMIQQGKFSKRNRVWRRIRKIVIGSAVCVAVIALAFMAPRMWVDIPEVEIPLVSTPFSESSLSGMVKLGEKGVNDVVLTLLDIDRGTSTAIVTVGGGNYAFDEIPTGNYRLEVEPPSGMELENGTDGFYLTVTDGEVLHDVVIRLCAREDRA